MDRYEDFLRAKSQSTAEDGFEPTFIPSQLFDFQVDLVNWALRQGRSAIFADCGLGKTPIQLTWAQNIVHHENGRVLVLTPLAVAAQTLREAEKFGIEAVRSQYGHNLPQSGIVVTNYEKLNYFDPNDFAGVVCDECFAPDTRVDVIRGEDVCQVYIKDVQCKDEIVNAAGRDTVRAVARREVHAAVRITIEGRVYHTSLHHPWFTSVGWRASRDMRSGNLVVGTGAAVRLVRKAVQSEVHAGVHAEVLRQELLREMADGYAGAPGEGPHSRGGREAWEVEVPVAQRYSRGEGRGRQVRSLWSHFRGLGEDGRCEEGVTISGEAWRERSRGYGSSVVSSLSASGIEGGVFDKFRKEDHWLSDLLQGGYRSAAQEDCHRGGRAPASNPTRKRPQEGGEAGLFRVDRVEVLELGHPDLERYRDADGKLYFYDVQATRHPSFSVDGMLVHNSSILKSFDGVRRAQITRFMHHVQYRLLCTATAAPNDYVELGTSSEALGRMGYVDMLGRFFVADNGRGAAARRGWGKSVSFRLKGHAEVPFWRWIASWARALRRPSDLGYDDARFVLPPLVERQHIIESATVLKGRLFEGVADGMREEREAMRRTLVERCEKVATLAAANTQTLAWCNLNAEGDMLERLLSGAVQVSGSDSDELKEERLLAFVEGQARSLVTKPRIGAFGLNLQNCAHVTVFPTHSFEQYYQGIRRCWRFGQKRPVTVDVVGTYGLKGIMNNLVRKRVQADEMFDRLVEVMRRGRDIVVDYRATGGMEVPGWL